MTIRVVKKDWNEDKKSPVYTWHYYGRHIGIPSTWLIKAIIGIRVNFDDFRTFAEMGPLDFQLLYDYHFMTKIEQ